MAKLIFMDPSGIYFGSANERGQIHSSDCKLFGHIKGDSIVSPAGMLLGFIRGGSVIDHTGKLILLVKEER
jgi:hypothetical protein